MAWERGLQSARRGGSIGRGGINSALRRPRRACRACRSAGILAGPPRAFHPLWRTKFIGTYAAVGRISDKVRSAASTERLLPLPATEEWGEGKPCKHCPKTRSTVSRRPSPWPSPRFAGRGYSWRRVVHPTVSSVRRLLRSLESALGLVENFVAFDLQQSFVCGRPEPHSTRSCQDSVQPNR